MTYLDGTGLDGTAKPRLHAGRSPGEPADVELWGEVRPKGPEILSAIARIEGGVAPRPHQSDALNAATGTRLLSAGRTRRRVSALGSAPSGA